MCQWAHSRNIQGITSAGLRVGCKQQREMIAFQASDLRKWKGVPFSAGTSWQEGGGYRCLKAMFAYNNILGNLL